MNISEVILDSLADDFESIIQIQNYLAYCGYAEEMHKLQKLLDQMLTEGLIYINYEISNNNNGFWYGMTPAGRAIWNRIPD